MNKWIAEFELEDGDIMPEYMDLEYKGARIDFHCRPLEQEPTTKNDLGVTSELEKNSKKLEKDFGELDCISRAEMLRYQQYLHGKMSNEENHKLWEFIKALPSVTSQEPKTGHWKAFIHNAYHGTDEDGEPVWREVTVYHCSQCNRRTVIKEKFCPNCGAKMVEPQESEV